MNRSALLLLLFAAIVPSVAPAQILNTLRSFDRQDLGWSGEIEGTVAVADGNTEFLEFETDASAQHLSARQRWAALGSFARRSTGDERIAENRVGHLRHNYRFLPWLSSIFFLQGQHDPFRRLETRLLAGTGARFDFLRGESGDGSLGATVMVEWEELLDESGLDADVRLSLSLSLFRPGSETVETDVAIFYQPRVDAPADARAFVAARFRVDVVGGLYFLARYGLQYDSRPPDDVKNRDQTLRSGVGWEF